MQISAPLRPSSAYFAISRIPSLRTSIITPKLLILDLNGTLLLRSRRHRARGCPIHPRPYMSTFQYFLFHESVKPWLEVRVWSSAQPHNVRDMVNRCFLDRGGELKAVWARDTFGLTASDYSRKVQTTKDLEKQWSANLGKYQYSAKTTVLLDDSPLKACLQPYNHICVPEYTQSFRDRDRDLRSVAQEFIRKDIEAATQEFDQTLIAVIGVLDEVREQSNVAGWIRVGGLWAGQKSLPTHATSPEPFLDNHSRQDTDVESDDLSSSLKEWPPSGNGAGGRKDTLMWYDHPPCFQYWVERGTRVVRSLDIPLEPRIIE